ncbi:MAG TPA: hypothetical protein VK789_04490 [Bryobacteraceae bacterium]|nr:hypothetical protein [Bryobacteraceae bacterium]
MLAKSDAHEETPIPEASNPNQKTRRGHRIDVLIAVVIALICAIPMLRLGASQYIEYDGYWHIFIAQQDKWSNFWQDIRVNAHPPLFFLLLKFIMHFGRSVLIYRSISLITGILSVLSLASIARKITDSAWWAYTAALAYGLSLPFIIVACEVRSYMLSALFILLSFSFLLDLASLSGSKRELRIRAGFVATAILACLSHYYAFYYAGAAAVLLSARYISRRVRRQPANWITELATILPLPMIIVVLYKTHANLKAFIQPHLAPYYYDPNGAESISGFLLRNWKNLLNLFLPWQVSSDAAAILIFALAAICATALLLGFLRKPGQTAVRAAWTIFIAAGMLAEIVFSAIAGKYPFGGDLRQQFILFPFFVLFTAILADRLTAPLPGKVRLAAAAAAVLAAVGISAIRFEQYPKSSEDIFADRMKEFDKLAPEPAGVYLDQWNLITFFIHHHNWRWTWLQQQPIPGIGIYRISRGQRQMLVFRDLTDWNVRADYDELYHMLAACLQAGHIPELSIFGVLQTPPAEPYSSFKVMRHAIARRAAANSICVQQLEIEPADWYATFRQSHCTAPAFAPPRVTGTFADTAEEIVYSGPWKHGTPSGALSNVAGSTAHLEFTGTGITWRHGTGPDRGFASVRIDGIPRNDVDLYSRTEVRQTSTTFDGLRPGDHTLELMVAGRKDTAATGKSIDIDSLIVH